LLIHWGRPAVKTVDLRAALSPVFRQDFSEKQITLAELTVFFARFSEQMRSQNFGSRLD